MSSRRGYAGAWLLGLLLPLWLSNPAQAQLLRGGELFRGQSGQLGTGTYSLVGDFSLAIHGVNGGDVILGTSAAGDLTGNAALTVEKFSGADITDNSNAALSIMAQKVGGTGLGANRLSGLHAEVVDTIGGASPTSTFLEGGHFKAIGVWPAGPQTGQVETLVSDAIVRAPATAFQFAEAGEFSVQNSAHYYGIQAFSVLQTNPGNFSTGLEVWSRGTLGTDAAVTIGNPFGGLAGGIDRGLLFVDSSIATGGFYIDTGSWSMSKAGAITGKNSNGSNTITGFGIEGAINVLSYGAKCDGVTDDKAALQAAINAANPNVTATTQVASYKYGADVLIPKGKCRFTSTLYVPSGVRLVGQGGLQLFTYDFIGGTLATIPISTLYYDPSNPLLAAVSLSGYVAATGARMATDGSLDSAGIGTGVQNGTYIAVQQPSLDNLAIVSSSYFPNLPTLGQVAGGTIVATTYFATVACAGGTGQLAQSKESSLAVSANNLLQVTAPTTCRSGVDTGYNVYVSTTSGTETQQNSVAIALGTNWTEPTTGLVTGAAPITASRLGIQAYAGEQALYNRVMVKNFQFGIKAHGSWRSSYRNFYGQHFNGTCMEINDTASSSGIIGGWCHGDGLNGTTGLWLANTQMSVTDFQIEQLDTGVSLNGQADVRLSVDFDANFTRAIFNATTGNEIACESCTINLAAGSTIPFLDAAAAVGGHARINNLFASNLAKVLGPGISGSLMNIRITNTPQGASEALSGISCNTPLIWWTDSYHTNYPCAAEVAVQSLMPSATSDLRQDYVFAGAGKYFLVYDQNGIHFKDFNTGTARFEFSNLTPFPLILDAGVIQANENATPTGGAFQDWLWADTNAHRWRMQNNGGAVVSVGGMVVSGTSALGVAAIAAGACAATVTTAAAGTVTTDAIEWSHNAAVVGGTNGSLLIHSFPTAGNVNFQECNPTAAAITPPADTLNWVVLR